MRTRIIFLLMMVIAIDFQIAADSATLPLSATLKSDYDPEEDLNIYHFDFRIYNNDGDPLLSKHLNQTVYNAEKKVFDPGYTWITREVYHDSGETRDPVNLDYIVIQMRGVHPNIADGEYKDIDKDNPDFRYELSYRFMDKIVPDEEIDGGFGWVFQSYKPDDDKTIDLHAIGSWGDYRVPLDDNTHWKDYQFRYAITQSDGTMRYTNFVGFNIPYSNLEVDPCGTYELPEGPEQHAASYGDLPAIDNRSYVTFNVYNNPNIGEQEVTGYAIIDVNKNELCHISYENNVWSTNNSDYQIVDTKYLNPTYTQFVLTTPIAAGETVYVRIQTMLKANNETNYFGIAPKAAELPEIIQDVAPSIVGKLKDENYQTYFYSTQPAWTMIGAESADGILFSQWKRYNNKTYDWNSNGDGSLINVLSHSTPSCGSMESDFYNHWMNYIWNGDDNAIVADESGNKYHRNDFLCQQFSTKESLGSTINLEGEYVVRAYIPDITSTSTARNRAANDTKYVVIENRTPFSHQIDDEVVTGVENVTVDNSEEIMIFDLMGRPLHEVPAKGMYIMIEGGKIQKRIAR